MSHQVNDAASQDALSPSSSKTKKDSELQSLVLEMRHMRSIILFAVVL